MPVDPGVQIVRFGRAPKRRLVRVRSLRVPTTLTFEPRDMYDPRRRPWQDPCSGLAPVAVFQCREGFQAALIRGGSSAGVGEGAVLA